VDKPAAQIMPSLITKDQLSQHQTHYLLLLSDSDMQTCDVKYQKKKKNSRRIQELITFHLLVGERTNSGEVM